ncbi:unnamed protein product [Lupinus luteus]|uniref:Pectinesterase inhibitor domain-containing protein n=1 Tax=Lupinus luteus TaxID=3873 RepID=A0AAV1WPK8_LUPLU
MPGGDDAQRKKRLVIISVSTFLLVAMVIGVAVSITFTKNVSIDEEDPKDNNKSHLSSTVKAVKTLCHPTDYKKECEESLTKEAGNTTDARKLIEIAFQITIKRIGDGLEKANILHEVEKEPRAKEALVTCKQLMDLSIEEFKRSIERLGKFDLNNLDNILTSLKVWLSGAVTYQETCLDAFENTTSDAGNKMKEVLQTAMHMSSNGLAIINELSKTFTSFHITKPVSRRLLQDADDLPVLGHDNDVDEFPEWVEDHVGVRRLLKMNSRKFMAHAIVAKDGSGNFTTITDALKNVPKKNQKPFIIWIKEGVYNEFVEVSRSMTHVVFVGDGSKKTRITGSKNFIDGINTYNTASVGMYQPSGIVIQGGAIVSDPNYYPVRFDNKAYLARPWKNFSRTIFLDTYIGDLIQPEGYMPWQTDKGLPTNTETCFYAEVNNRGPGSDLAKRVKWQGVKNLTPQIATDFYPSRFFHGDDWIRVTNIPYSSGKNPSKH